MGVSLTNHRSVPSLLVELARLLLQAWDTAPRRLPQQPMMKDRGTHPQHPPTLDMGALLACCMSLHAPLEDPSGHPESGPSPPELGRQLYIMKFTFRGAYCGTPPGQSSFGWAEDSCISAR